MDKSWIDESNHTSSTYLDGVIQLLNYAFRGRDIDSVVYCSCWTCLNRAINTRREILLHCIRYGFDPSYRVWTSHGEVMGETSTSTEDRQRSALWEDDLDMLMRDCAMPDHLGEGINEGNTANDVGDDHRDDNNRGWRQMLEDMQNYLISGCKKISRLSFIARLLHLKVLCQWSNHLVDLLLELLRDALPDAVILPKNYYKAKKITKKLGFNYKSIDACINNCMLFTGDDVKLKSCAICRASRFVDGSPTKAAKKMRYFPLVHRLQRWFLSSKNAASMCWHAEGRVNDGLLHHPADSAAWKNFNRRHPSFASDIRNVRLGLATDGFNPFGNMSVSYNIWPVVLVIYNLPPWLCMKQPSFILSTIIDGPKGPGERIDAFLQPLVAELKELWSTGVRTYDAVSKENFQMRAALMWTISDFLEYAMLSGWPTRGANACPNCGMRTHSAYLKKGHKLCYCGHRRYLPDGLRLDRQSFDGTMDFAAPTTRITCTELVEQIRDVPTTYVNDDLITQHLAHQSRKRRRHEHEEV
ncbi:uncharacterized protein LOC127249292 [Andrographis paniculata]|uniref:uncharacterized protein LOC127249292 n=1 Tax=Andrographis paniculata TaxID=175694 RepID=UPI0021E8EC00|nr:uncharacterized protein LOC127249292 [Andrographis paniculata]